MFAIRCNSVFKHTEMDVLVLNSMVIEKKMLDFLKDFWQYMKARRCIGYCLLLLCCSFSVTVVFGGSSAVAPFVSPMYEPHEPAPTSQRLSTRASAKCRAYCHWMVFYASNCIYCSTSHYGLVGQFFTTYYTFCQSLDGIWACLGGNTKPHFVKRDLSFYTYPHCLAQKGHQLFFKKTNMDRCSPRGCQF